MKRSKKYMMLQSIVCDVEVIAAGIDVLREEYPPVRLRIAAQMMAALIPEMVNHTPAHIAQRAVSLCDALMDEVLLK